MELWKKILGKMEERGGSKPTERGLGLHGLGKPAFLSEATRGRPVWRRRGEHVSIEYFCLYLMAPLSLLGRSQGLLLRNMSSKLGLSSKSIIKNLKYLIRRMGENNDQDK